jgi:hypothetical protein
LELEQDRRALPDARLDLGNVVHLCGLSRVEHDPRRHQSEHQQAKGQKLGLFWAPAQQDNTGNSYQEGHDPNR